MPLLLSFPSQPECVPPSLPREDTAQPRFVDRLADSLAGALRERIHVGRVAGSPEDACDRAGRTTGRAARCSTPPLGWHEPIA